MLKPNLFALFVGINKYAHIRPLMGCENDTARMHAFLEKHVSKTMVFHPLVLNTAEASKAAIVSAFEDHLIRGNKKNQDVLQEGDVALFYFSGHGALEKANQVFWHAEPNQYLETIACYDSNLDTGKDFLADKELRYLIHRAAQPGVEVVTIFDCCHSGDNTRSPAPYQLRERLAGIIEERHWDDFIFAKDGISLERVATQGLDLALPQGTHIQLAACNSHESAWENVNGGIFTTALLDALEKSQGDINYLELKHRTRNAVRNHFIQYPQLYTHTSKYNKSRGASSDEYKKMPFKIFLGGAIREKPISAVVRYNGNKRRWELDKGSVYGVTTIWEGLPQEIVVSISSTETISATIKSVYPGFAEIEFEPYADVLSKEIYEAFVPSLMFRLLKISLEGEAQGLEAFNKFAPPGILRQKGLMPLITPYNQPEYRVHASNGQFLIMPSGSEKPLPITVKGYAYSDVAILLDRLQAIRRWTFVQNLQNASPLNQLRASALSFELVWNGALVQPDLAGHYHLLFEETNASQPSGNLKFTITNKIRGTLFIGVVYLGATFEISSKGFWEDSDTVRPLHTECSKSEETPAVIEQFFLDNNWPEELIYYKVIAAVSEFDLDLMDQEKLDESVRHRSDKGMKRTHMEPNPQDWYTWLLPLHLVNPNYQP